MIRFKNFISEDYFIDPITAVITDKNGVEQKTTLRNGYFCFKGEDVHHIQMYTHIGYKPYLHIHHIDKNKLNNSLSNLIYLTISEHMKLHRSGKPSPNKGKKFPTITKSMSGNTNTRDRIWVNNGVINKMVYPNEIPEGFVKGQLKKRSNK
jgi:hypothetical protein